ncbi:MULTISPECIES: MFS transporter [unclassified Polynucleobacter]|uniref:MFS transporter n=1 Tax=unclassified Polynucleobacter TaxID=2640945 RepID=UPI0025736FCB|nr:MULTISPECIES: MFS transporter [unclassified Polynucleobacter]BEI42942.1 MFS transporter [Polynucleobacter sp. HIN10]BEI44696.1 MFS transporter [Polynucleobacter sp. HIN11]
MSTATAPVERKRPMTKEERKVILASSAGTIFEWYDFYLYGSLAAIIGAQFFSSFPEATRNVFALLAFAAGFLVRPFGALVFGRLGDLVGRKYTFLITILIMGISTFVVGLLPSYETIGWLAPVTLIALRMLQGLALGGEYGGAVVYVAEHAPNGRRGYFTSWIQTTATLGLLLSLMVILGVRTYVGEDAFKAWGWRIPFLLSIFLLGISIWIRLQMEESPAFKKMKEEGTQSKAPISEAFGNWKNGKFAVIALLGLVAGQAVVWYTGQFYALFYLQTILRVDMFSANVLIAWALIFGTGGFVVFGSLSDRIGRKKIILAGCLIAAVTYFPVFKSLTALANPALSSAQQNTKVIVIADKNDCSFQFNPTGTAKFANSCDVTKALLARSSVNYSVEYAPDAIPARVKIGDTEITSYEAKKLTGDDVKAVPAAFNKAVNDALAEAGYPVPGKPTPGIIKLNGFFDIFTAQAFPIVLILTYLVILVTMVYGPIAAALVELFPTRIRYTGMSLPYHIGNGWFGGLMPATAFAMIAQSGDPYYGLWYPIVIAVGTFVIGMIFVPENYKKDIFAEQNNR